MMRLTIIGFGNQAKAWAQNLQDSAYSIRVALMPQSTSIPTARSMGFEVVEIGTDDFYQDSAFALLTPDHTHSPFLKKFGANFKTGSVMLYAHGFSCSKDHFQKLYPNLNHILFAPKSIGSELRQQFLLKGKLGAVFSLEHVQEKESHENWIRNLARALGITMGPYETSFLRETQADLYSEQGLLCSIIPYTAGEMFQHLVDKGIEPELAYFECWHEMKLIINAMVEKGPEGFFDLISPNALIGSEKGYEKLINSQYKASLKGLLSDIQDGTFNSELEATDVEATRQKIRQRWSKSALMKTFSKINQE